MPVRIFLVDDHAIVRDGLRLLLETQADFMVVGEASDGREAITSAEKMCADVAIIDVGMPGVNGVDAARGIRSACPKTEIIILTMYVSEEHIHRALRAGAKGYILKESAGKELIHAVRAVFEGRRYFSKQIMETVMDAYAKRSEPAGGASPLERLSPRELEILQFVVDGKSNHEIADMLSLSIKTVETYRSRLMAKLGIRDIPHLVKYAIRHGLTALK